MKTKFSKKIITYVLLTFLYVIIYLFIYKYIGISTVIWTFVFLIFLNVIKKNRLIQSQYDEIKIANNILKIQINELTKIKNKLEHLSSVDELTGLNNRRSFDKHFVEFWTKAVVNSQYLSIIFIDIDFFKQYNDVYGHLEGDKCLKNVGREISQHTAKDAFSARFGGEEFIIIIDNKTLEETLIVAEHLRTSIESLKIELSTITLPYLTVSIGVSTVIANNSIKSTKLIEMADNALYRAKLNGRNRTESNPPCC